MKISSIFNLAVLLLTGTQGFSQIMKIEGDLSDFQSPSVMITAGKEFITLKVENGKFSGSIPVGKEPEKRMFTFGKKVIPVFVEEGTLFVSGSALKLRTIRISGTKTENDRRIFEKELDNAGSTWRLAQKDTSMQAFYANTTIHEELNRKLTISFLNAHPDSYYSLALLNDWAISFADKIPYFEKLSPAIKQTQTGIAFTERMVQLSRSADGVMVIDFTKDDIDGKPVSITSFRGKYVLIDFWASWCKPCRMEIPNVLIAFNRYRNKNFTVLGVTIDDDISKWKEAVKEENLPWTQVRDRNNKKSELLEYYGITGIPSTLFIDPDGKIIARDLRGAQLQKKLIEIFGKPN